MSKVLYLLLVYTLIPLGVLVIIWFGEPMLTVPQRVWPQMSDEGARALSVGVLATLGVGLMMFLAFRLILGY